MSTPDELTTTVAAEDAGDRLDRLLPRRFTDISRARFQRLIVDGHVRVDGETIVEPRHRVKPGSRIDVVVPAPLPAAPAAEPIPLSVVYEDEALIVIDKPPGLVVHPAAGNWSGTLVNALIAHSGDSLSGIGGEKRPGIVHRLDKDTSGLMVVAKTDAAHRSLSEQFAAHGRDGRLHRAYRAVVWGKPPRREGRIEIALGRDAANRKKMSVRSKGKPAVTRYRVLATSSAPGSPSLVECRLETGRTHQIRVHLAALGHPLLGDATYGSGFAASARRLGSRPREALAMLGRQALHAGELGFDHPVTGKPMLFRAKLPPDFQGLLQALDIEDE